MTALRRIIALAMLAAWLPATLHCAIEAAGLDQWLGCHDEAAHDASHCTDDACHAIEGVAYKPDAAPIQVPVPSLTLVCHSLICVAVSAERSAPTPVVAPPVEPPRLLQRWHFVRRAAPSARAPACIA
ncbi:MAG: hypothetical protein ABIQ12_01565 [Opitutaceae bacterium]